MINAKTAGDAALLLETRQDRNVAARLAAATRAAGLPGVIDIVPGASTVLVTFEPGSISGPDLAGLEPGPDAGPGSSESAEIEVVYDGPDLAAVAATTGLTTAEVIARHQAGRYQVGWLGFSPGFGYLTGLDPVLAAVPRRDSPRLSVPAGSVAIAGGLAAVYPAASPGGWQLLGRTSAALWDPAADPPALLSPGMSVRFRAVASLPDRPAPAGTGDQTARRSPRTADVLQPGPLATIQDLGRPGLAHLGVPRSGAADLASLRRANRLAGNDEGDACLEITLGRLALRLNCDATIALTGAPAPMKLTAPDLTAPDLTAPHDTVRHDAVPHNTAITVAAGTVLRLGAPATGLRSYLAVGGGFDIPPVLGSRSADLLSGLGPGRLRAGDRLPLGRPRSRPENLSPHAAAGGGQLSGTTVLRVIAGPRDDWFGPQSLETLAAGSFSVSAESNRTGLRLDGPPLRRSRPGELPSEGVATGSLQVTHDGRPILLLADHPVTGGYPVIAVVCTADLGAAAQLRPGQQVRFSLSPPAPGRQ